MDLTIFWLCFVPLFIAVDPIGILPIFISFVRELERKRIRAVIISSIITAMIVALVFLYVGEALLRLLGITVADFLIAGGIILFFIAINDLFSERKILRESHDQSVGPVPIGVPLIAGPGVLTTSMLLLQEYGFLPTTLAVVSNITLTGIVFCFSGTIIRLLGNSGTKIISKIANLFLAAIAVMMVRKGFTTFITEFLQK